MKKLICVLLVLIMQTGCAGVDTGGAQEQGLNVYTSFYAMYDFAKTIGGDRIHLQMLVPPGMEPHDWEPSPKDMASLQDADIFIYNGMGMEHFVDKVKTAVSNPSLLFVEASEGIPDIGGDPHVWLNPMYAKTQLEAITDALAVKDSDNAAYYRANFAAASEKLDELEAEYQSAVETFARKDIVVTHEAYGYLCHAFGLHQVAIEGLSADSDPSPAKMAEIIDFVNEHQVRYIFFVERDSSKAAEAIAAETDAITAVLSPFEGMTDENEPQDYFSVMYANLDVLKKALQ